MTSETKLLVVKNNFGLFSAYAVVAEKPDETYALEPLLYEIEFIPFEKKAYNSIPDGEGLHRMLHHDGFTNIIG